MFQKMDCMELMTNMELICVCAFTAITNGVRKMNSEARLEVLNKSSSLHFRIF